MKYKVTLNSRTYEVEVNNGQAVLLDEYEAVPQLPLLPQPLHLLLLLPHPLPPLPPLLPAQVKK